MINKSKYICLFLIIFVGGALTQGCNFSFSIGNSNKLADKTPDKTPDKITDSEAETIATKTLQNFNRAVLKGDFQQFQQTEIAPSFKNELTAEKFNTAFAKFINNKIDIRPNEGTHFNWTSKPEIDNNFLNLNGNYPAQSGKTVTFKLQYVKDANDWKLKYIDIDVS